eukprot:TRINITY_DN9301_c0_g2_i1.p3 TRINITY_DN9301_c0_g2~~TRINITY_DN9301_c0_g2_i1.p3  ORF type:complete len:112 (+),score=22.59 TRINITY_DN9301_c0_g2_i1:51-338(+)
MAPAAKKPGGKAGKLDDRKLSKCLTACDNNVKLTGDLASACSTACYKRFGGADFLGSTSITKGMKAPGSGVDLNSWDSGTSIHGFDGPDPSLTIG